MLGTPNQSSGVNAQVLEPSYFLQRKVGGPASRMINSLSIKRAEAALQSVLPALEEEVLKLVATLQILVSSKSNEACVLIWQNARHLSGIAGYVGKVSVGQTADILCQYLDGTTTGFQPDPKLLSTIATVISLALKNGADDDPMVGQLLADSLLAVKVQRQREGR